MRPISRFSHRLRSMTRHPPETPLHRLLRRGAIASLALGAPVGALWWSGQQGYLARAEQWVGEMSRQAAVSTGLVVAEVNASGRSRTEHRELQRVLESQMGRPILEVDVDRLKSQLERLPWVRTAAVRRQLPSTLFVAIEEHRPLALWQEQKGSRTRLISDTGETVPVANLRAYAIAPLLRGPGAPQHARALFDELGQEPELWRRVTIATRIGNRRWDLVLDGRIDVRLPEAEPAEAWQKLAQHDRATRVLERAVDVIDLRNPEWVVLRMMEEPVLPQGGRGGRGA